MHSRAIVSSSGMHNTTNGTSIVFYRSGENLVLLSRIILGI